LAEYLLVQCSCYRRLLIAQNFTDSEIVNDVENSTVKLIDPSIFITVRLDDWRDEHNNKAIMWSRESKYHPDFGKQYSKTAFQRTQASSRRFSIIILGIAIIFVIYIYFYNVAQERKLQRHSKLLRAQTEFTRRYSHFILWR
ncbi:hypothetical protein COOONC_08073, partial [Cooperia oncophora]